MELASYLAQQKQGFIRAFISGHYPVGIQNPLQLSRFITPTATWRWDDAFEAQKAFIRTVGDGHKEYWIDVNEKAYRAAFKAFLQTEYKVSQTSIPSNLHADHMLNKEFAKRHGLHFVRIAFVPKAYNEGWGGKIEKLLTRIMARDNSIYRLDYFIFMKILEVAPPRDEVDYRSRRKSIAQRLAAETGMDTAIVLEGLDGIFSLWKVL